MGFILGLDFSILDFIYNNIRCAFLDPIMAGFSYFAEGGIGWVIMGLILLIPKKTRPAAATALGAMLIGALCGEVLLKHIVARERPFLVYEAFHHAPMPFKLNTGEASGYSFPSGHTCLTFAPAVSYFKINKAVGFTALAAALITGFSRLYNYVHFPSDVLAGMVLGIISALIAIYIFKKFSFDDKLLRLRKKS